MAETVKIVIDADDKASKEIQGVHSALDKLGGMAKGLALGGIAVGVAGIAALGNVLMDSVSAAMEAQAAQAQLAAVIESTGGIAGVTADMANRLATELQNVTRFEDDAVLGAESILLTFTNIGREVFPDAMWAAADLSQALGTDLQSSVMMLGKALNDPLSGITALKRAGVQLTDQQEAMIKKMIEAGDTMGAQKIILQELETQVGGSAKAYGETLAGKLEIFNNTLGDVKETIGNALIPALSTLVDSLGPKLIEWAEAFAKWVETDGARVIQDLVDGFIEFIPKIEEAFGLIRNFLTDDSENFVLLWQGVQKAIEDLTPVFDFFKQMVSDFVDDWNALAGSIQSALDAWNRWRDAQGAAGGGGSGAGGNGGSNGVYWYNYPGGSGNSLPMGGNGAPITVNVNIAGSADARTMRGAVLDALSLARARGMA